jgi:hypothetical protein
MRIGNFGQIATPRPRFSGAVEEHEAPARARQLFESMRDIQWNAQAPSWLHSATPRHVIEDHTLADGARISAILPPSVTLPPTVNHFYLESYVMPMDGEPSVRLAGPFSITTGELIEG